MTQVPVRERVVQQIVRKFQAMNLAAKDENNGVYVQSVVRAELDRTQQYKGTAVSVMDLDEFYIYQTCYLQCTLRVGIEFYSPIKVGGIASTQLGIVLAQIKKVMLSDTNLIEEGTGLQLTENVRIVQVDLDVESQFDKIASGFVQFDVIYRTDKEDPFKLM